MITSFLCVEVGGFRPFSAYDVLMPCQWRIQRGGMRGCIPTVIQRYFVREKYRSYKNQRKATTANRVLFENMVLH